MVDLSANFHSAAIFFSFLLPVTFAAILPAMFKTQDLHVREIVRLSLAARDEGGVSRHTRGGKHRRRKAANASFAFCARKTRACWSSSAPARFTTTRRAGIRRSPQRLRKEFADRMEIVMRVYFEKPRTTIGWKGLINDPHLDGSQDIEAGLKIARRLLRANHWHGSAGGHGISGSHRAAIHRRPRYLGRHRRAHDGIADASRNGQRSFDARRFQERHGRQLAGRH